MFEDENDTFFTPQERINALGFKPQKEIVINNLLPYADQLDEESVRLFAQIKCNLGKAVMLREMKPACGVWTARLIKYLRIYGLKFSKEDHIAVIKLVYELLLIPDLEPCKVHKFATLFIMLTKKRYLIPPEDLTLPWRPLYELGRKIFDKSAALIGMYHYLTTLESSYIGMIKCAKPYFELSATKEILAEFLPKISPWSTDTHDLLGQLSIFLPVALYPKHSAFGHELWLDDLITLWDTCYNSLAGVGELLALFSCLAKRNPGAVDWTPHVPSMFTRFMHAFNLPVGYKDMQPMRSHSLDIKHVSKWIVWTVAPDGLVLKHLRSFLIGVESYLHTANSGRWSYKLRDLLRKLAREFLNRVRRERDKKFKISWENQTPPAYCLREEDITEFVKIVLEPTLLAVHSRSGVADVSLALQNLATLRPAIVVPPLLERLRTSLESLTEPHRVTAAMLAVAAVARPMLRGPAADYPEGPTNVVPLLMSALPGLDPNDTKKTLVTLHFILIFSWMVPFIDCSSASEHWPDLTEEELLTCELTAQFEDFVLLFLERLFSIVDSSAFENVRLETKDSDSLRSKVESVIETALSSTTTAVLMQCSPKIFSEALRKFKQFATNTTFETNVAGSMIGVLLRVFARVDSAATLAAFVPQLCEEVSELLSTDESLHDENPSRDLLYHLLLLSHVVECDGKVLLQYIPTLTPMLDRALKMHSRDAYVRACDLLSHILASLSVVEIQEFRSSSKDYSQAPKDWLPIRDWGKGCPLREAKFVWHTPSVEEIQCAQMLFDRYGIPEMGRLRAWLSGERDMCRKRRLRGLFILNSVLSCITLMPPPEEPPVVLVESAVPATSFPLASGVKEFLTLGGENVRVEMSKLIAKVQQRLLDEKSDDTRGLEMLVLLWDRVSGVRPSRTGPSLEARIRSFAALERVLDGKGGPPGGGRIRTLLADAVKMQDEARIDLQSDAGISATGLTILMGLFELAINTYTLVRILSQLRLYWMLSHYAYSFRALIPHLANLLSTGGEGDEWHARHKGALYIMLGPRVGPLVAKQDWEVARTLWPAILTAPLSEKPSLLRLEQGFSDTLHRQFPTVNTKLEMSRSCVEAAKVLVPETEFQNEAFINFLEKAEEKEKQTSDKNEQMYNELVKNLVAIAETPNVQWRRLELTMQMLTHCPSLQTKYSASAVKLIVNSLIHDDIVVRRLALKLTLFVLKQRKLKHKKIKVDPYEVAGVPRPDKVIPGYRKDNEWAMWSEERVPKTDEEWDRPWSRSPLVGFFCWPEKLEVAAPSNEQPRLDRNPDEMEEGERYIYEFFDNDANVEKLVSFLTVEEKKGKDKFNGCRFSMFRNLFQTYGVAITSKFLEHAANHAANGQEASQRFASEIIAAAIRAPRYWDRQNAMCIYEKAVAVLNIGLMAVTPEMTEDWGTCVASAVDKLDPHRGHYVLKSLVDLCMPSPAEGADADADQNSSFGICARLYALQGALASLSWRGAPLSSELLQKLDAAKFLQHPYQNVRERVGSILMTIFDTELVFPGGTPGPAPRIADFLEDTKLKVAALYDEHGEIVIKTSAAVTPVACVAEDDSILATPEPELGGGTEGLVSVASVARLTTEEPVNDESQPEKNTGDGSEADTLPLVGRSAKGLAERLEPGLTLSGDTLASSSSPSPREHARAVNLLTTVLRGCMGIIVRGVHGTTRTKYELLKTACALSARGPPQPHDELGRAADAFLASLALAHHGPEVFDSAIEVLETVSMSRSWWARHACVDFAQTLLFYCLPYLHESNAKATRAEEFALKLMRDSRLEVRQAAAKLLTGLMHCQALPDEGKTLNKLVRSCRSKQIVERHCGVLGLCSYLSSRPYSLGSKIGIVLSELSRHINAPDPVPSAIRTALANFRRTHQDDWAKHREALTEEELDLLADLTSPPTYCA